MSAVKDDDNYSEREREYLKCTCKRPTHHSKHCPAHFFSEVHIDELDFNKHYIMKEIGCGDETLMIPCPEKEGWIFVEYEYGIPRTRFEPKRHYTSTGLFVFSSYRYFAVTPLYCGYYTKWIPSLPLTMPISSPEMPHSIISINRETNEKSYRAKLL